MEKRNLALPALPMTASVSRSGRPGFSRPSITARLLHESPERRPAWYMSMPSSDALLRPSDDASDSPEGLTTSELDALASAANGMTARQAGRSNFKSADTIKTQLGAARLKLGARNTTHAVAIAMQRQLLVDTTAAA